MRWALLAVVALAAAFAYPMQVNGYNQNAHYALVRALAVYGTPKIDRTQHEIGQLSTQDSATYKGHVYAAKAPGLAFVSVPPFLVVRAVGMRTTGDPTRAIWALHLFGAALAALAAALLVWLVGERLEPGLGLPAAVTLGLATLMLPFGTLFFSHALSATLGLAAFVLLWREREGPPRLALVTAAGVVAGLAVGTDYPLALVGAILGLYALSRARPARRAVAYAGGVAAGVLPLLAFNWWAFGTPTHIAYEDYYRGTTIHGAFGFGLPSLSAAHDLLFSSMGLLTLTPVVVAGVVGAILLLRRRRAEALVVLAVVVTYVVYNASLRYASPFGGLGPPRYLVPLVPFAAVPLAFAFRRLPLATSALALVSAFQMVVMTATGPLAAYDGDWLRRAGDHVFVETGAAIVGVTGWYAILPFFAAAAVAALVAAGTLGRVQVRRDDAVVATVGLAAWAAIALAADNPNGRAPETAYVVAAVVAAAVVVAGLALIARRTIHPLTARPTRKSTAEQTGHVSA